jgi:hypothetical protein
MAVYTLVSASGSPGVTSTVLGLATVWPRPVIVVEADPTGGSAILAGFFRGQVRPAGLVDLVPAQRAGLLAATLTRIAYPIPDTSASVLVGAHSHEQALGLSQLWEPLAEVLRDLASDGADVIVDAGRLGLEGSATPLVERSDLTLLVARSNLPAVVGARSWAESLAEGVVPGHQAQLLLVGVGRPYAAGEVSRALGLPVLGGVEWDPDRAAVFSDGASAPQSRWRKDAGAAFAASGYVRSISQVCELMMRAAAQDGTERGLRARLVAQLGEGNTQ